MEYKINDIIKHKNAYYYYIISSMDKNNIVLYRVYYKNNKWNIDYKTNEFNSIHTILPITSLKYFTKNIKRKVNKMNSKLKEITEILSNHGYNKSSNNDCSGDWYHGYYYKWNGFKEDFCEAIVIPNHEGFGESVIDCFINDCDKPKEIDFINTKYERIIFIKPSYNILTEEEINKFLDEDEIRQELYLNSI